MESTFDENIPPNFIVENEIHKFLEKIDDGYANIFEDYIVIRVGHTTFHPLKAVKGFLSGADFFLISKLFERPSNHSLAKVEEAVQSVLVRSMGTFHGQTMGLKASRLQSVIPEAYSQRVDPTALAPLSLPQARQMLSRLSQATSLPILAPVDSTSGKASYCYLGQHKKSPRAYEVFNVQAHPFTAWKESSVLEDFFDQFREEIPRHQQRKGKMEETHLTISAIYDMFMESRDRISSGESTSCAQLIAEWTIDQKDLPDSKGPTSPPPAVCSSTLVVGFPPGSLSSAGVNFRSILDHLEKLWGGCDQESKCEALGEGAASGLWRTELQELLESTKSHTLQSITAQTKEEDDNSQQPISTSHTSLEEDGRHDLDFTEQLWTVFACTHSISEVTSVLDEVFRAVQSGQIFPVIGRTNGTVLGVHLREGLRLAQATRYGSLLGSGNGVQSWEEWSKRGQELAQEPRTAVEVGVHKLRRDLAHWFQTEVQVSESELSWHLYQADSGATEDTVQSIDISLQRLAELLNILDLVSLARSCGAPWQALQSLGHTALQQHRCSKLSEAPPFFLVSMPNCLPPQIRTQLSDPLQWTLHIDPTRKRLNETSGTSEQNITLQQSYFLTSSKHFQPISYGDKLLLSPQLLQFAQQSLSSLDVEFRPQVLRSICGSEHITDIMLGTKTRIGMDGISGVGSSQISDMNLFVCSKESLGNENS